MRHLLTCAATFVLLCGASLVNAKTINLYSEAKEGSKVTGTLNTETGVTIVFTPKNSEWLKVANPVNGDVGWVKNSDLDNNGYSVQFVTGKGPNSYSFYQFGSSTNQPSREQIEMEIKRVERQQRLMQQHMQNMFNDMFSMFSPPAIFVPVILVPERQIQNKATPTKSVQKPKEEKNLQVEPTTKNMLQK